LDIADLLFDAAVFLTSSGALNGVAESFVTHEIGQQIYSNVITADSFARHPSGWEAALSAIRPTANSASDHALASPVNPASLASLGGSVLLQELSSLPRAEVAQFVRANPATVSKLLVNPPGAHSVVSWWGSLSPSARTSLSVAAPELVGNLDGVPFSVRDQANRRFLAQSIASLKKSIASGSGRAQLVESRHHLDILTQISRTLRTAPRQPERQLLTFDPSGEGRAAVVVGNLTKADYVTYLVPGMFFTVQGQMYDWTAIAADLQTEQSRWLTTLASADPSFAGKTAATVSWIGYTTPGVLDVASLSLADQGAKFLGNAVHGVQATRAGSEPFVTLVTHSYGSTAAMIELADGGAKVDALAMVGSPGGAAQSASALGVKNDNVYVGEAAWDPVVNTAFYGSDPGSSKFGAKKIDVAGGTDAITHKTLAAAVGHLGYFDPGSQAMRNLALIGLNEGALVTDGTLADAHRTLADANLSQPVGK
jgi:hypothetical protein